MTTTEISTKALDLVRGSMKDVVAKKTTLSDVLNALRSPEPAVVERQPPKAPTFTQDTLDALKRLPEVFGQVVVNTDRALTAPELHDLMEERKTIDLVLPVLEKRKSESMREVLANHADHVLPEEDRVGQDAKGHYAPRTTQEIPVPGTGMKIQRYASGGKPSLTMADIEKAYEEGDIDRKTYLAITVQPPRALNESGLHKAIQKDPALLFTLAPRAKSGTPITTVKIAKDS